MKNTISIQELTARAEEYAQDCFDNSTESLSVEFVAPYQIRYTAKDDTAKLFGATNIARGDLSNRAFNQLAERIDAPSTRWLSDPRSCTPQLRADVMNLVLGARGNKNWFIRHKGDTVRAVLSDKFTKFDNTEFLDLVATAVDTLGTEVRVHRPEVGDNLRAYILIPSITFDRDGINPDGFGGLHPAVYIGNSEIGDGTARANGGLFRKICSNGMIYGWQTESVIKVRHVHIKSELMRALIADAIAQGLRMSERAAKAFVEAYSVHIKPTSLAPIINAWASKYGITVEARNAWAATTWSETIGTGNAGDPRKADLVNALTYVSQNRGSEERETMERMAGDLLASRLPIQHLAQIEMTSVR